MPAPEVSVPPHEMRPVVGHVNLMVDTFLANVDGEDLRPIVRGLLSSGQTGIAKTFTEVARSYYSIKREPYKVKTRHLFAIGNHGDFVPTEHYDQALVQARSLYGIGMGLAGLEVLSSMIEGTMGVRWDEDDKLFHSLVVLDADITQAIQSCKEEREAGRIPNRALMQGTVNNLRSVLTESSEDVRSWGGVFPFERALATVQIWKV